MNYRVRAVRVKQHEEEVRVRPKRSELNGASNGTRTEHLVVVPNGTRTLSFDGTEDRYVRQRVVPMTA